MRNLLFLLSVSFSTTVIQAQTIANASFETWADPTYCNANTVPDHWLTYSNGAAQADKSDYTICPHTIPGNASNGNVSARFVSYSDSGGEGIYQDVAGFIVGNVYTISFDYAGSNLYGGDDDVQFHLFIDDIIVNSTPVFSPSKNTWSTLSHAFTATATTHKIGLRLYTILSTSGEAEADNFVLELGNTTSLEPLDNTLLTVFPNPSSGLFTIKGSSLNHTTTIKVINALGQELSSKTTVYNDLITIDLTNEAPGVYLLNINDEVSSRVVKLVKQQ